MLSETGALELTDELAKDIRSSASGHQIGRMFLWSMRGSLKLVLFFCLPRGKEVWPDLV